jgi:hypothetical protein
LSLTDATDTIREAGVATLEQVAAASASFCEEGELEEGEGRENDAGAANGGDVDMRDAEVRAYEDRDLGLTRLVSLLTSS